ncbi:hypothetical protein, partial [uncultured Helicobacter sp.]|uniref:hypothetical protein n=1 Tax=uncultured Helicobacter sp. TaxID=175537 RepID=UPI00261BBAFF
MVSSSRIVSVLLFSSVAWGVTIQKWGDIPQAGITQNTDGNFTYNNTDAQTGGFILSSNIFFQNSNANLNIRTNISGNWNGQNATGLIFNGTNGGNNNGKYTFNKGNISFFIDSSGIKTFGQGGYFQLSGGSSLDINANLTITSSANSNFRDVGLFGVDGSTLKITDADLKIDLSNTTSPNIFRLQNNSTVEINTGGNKAGQNIFLKGGIEVKNTSSFTLNLSNQNSYYEGTISLQDNAKFTLNLSNSSATFTTYSQMGNGVNSTLSLENSSTLNSTIIGN